MRLFQPDLAFKDENPNCGILKLTATVKKPPTCVYGRDLVDSAAESRLVLTHHFRRQNFEHLWSSPLDDGYSGKQSWSQMQRQDRICWSRLTPSFRGDDIIEIRNNRAEHPESPRFVPSENRSQHPSHQKKTRDRCRRCPCSDTALGFIVEKPFSHASSPVIAAERRGAAMPAWVAEQTTAPRAGDAPAEKLAAKNGSRFVVTRMTG
ncbi:hypothetical protein [Sinorhizobium meliloti]|uniref:hypothetical protein n=1 Tax=Rhizobium meliloti TaxID=382 RepID=UPI002380B32D|nr:hypothetical protein [Sinorhizobium meliloti]MDE3819745.1 hypothetical protein [Sinorhizobium meliloti]